MADDEIKAFLDDAEQRLRAASAEPKPLPSRSWTTHRYSVC
ncbi:hypothetical protein [Mesorhizobium sp. L103C131B0]|nr:hypothetical protein [Mesorhizobium sp. L103C131B0]